MTEHIPSPESLFNKLTQFAYARDPQFKQGHTDALDFERKSRKVVGYMHDEYDHAIELPIYNERLIRFSAEREPSHEKESQPSLPVGFTIQQEIIRQVNQVPAALRDHIDDETLECYDVSEPGDLNVVSFVHYSARRNDGDILLDRNIGYILRDLEAVVYETSELIGQPAPELIPIAHRQKTLRVFSPIPQDAVEDKIEQVSYDAVFDEYIDGVANMEYFMALTSTRDNDAIVSMLGLVRHLKQNRALPKKLLL